MDCVWPTISTLLFRYHYSPRTNWIFFENPQFPSIVEALGESESEGLLDAYGLTRRVLRFLRGGSPLESTHIIALHSGHLSMIILMPSLFLVYVL